MKREERFSIKWQVLRVILLCWLLPIIIIIGASGYYILQNHFSNLEEGFQKQLIYGNELAKERVNAAIEASRKASKDKVLRETFLAYKSGEWADYRAYTTAKDYLTEQYRLNDAFYLAICWTVDNPSRENSGIYNLRSGGSYHQLKTYWEKDHEAVEKLAKDLDTAVGFLNCDGRLYMVRNIMSRGFEPTGVLVLRMNIQYCFRSFLNIPMEEAVTLTLNDQTFAVNGDELSVEKLGIEFDGQKAGSVRKNGVIYAYQKVKSRDYQFQTVMKMRADASGVPAYGYAAIVIGMFVGLVPLFLISMKVFRKQVTAPVEDMMRGANEIERGNMGYQLQHEPANLEFGILFHTFNHMSETLKNQFERIYMKEIALRDARIMALQSHINPHFMNNTLEIIIWEARLAGNLKVTKMIEALATLMDAAIDRKKQPEIPLSEELIYVHAYLYITKVRFGKRLEIVEELADDIMDYQIPRLILQPIIENAIEHGIVPGGTGTVVIRGWQEDSYLFLEIVNDGTISPKKEESVKELLSEDYNASQDNFANMGIANVNQRLRIMYGDTCGLTIKKSGSDKVSARLTIRISQTDQKNTINNRPGYSNSPMDEG